MKKYNIPYEREKEIFIEFEGSEIGKFYADFIINREMILEVKTERFIKRENIRQVARYLKATHLQLGIIVNF